MARSIASATRARSRKGGRAKPFRPRAVAAAVASAVLIGAAISAGAQAPDGAAALETVLAGCGECHGEDGNSATASIPSLAGQPEIFLTTQLILFREGLRHSAQMAPRARGLSDATVVALAAHFAALPARAAPTAGDPDLLAQGRRLAQAGRCGGCHLPDFSGRQQIPRLAGQREDYLAAALAAYRDETRGGADTTMIEVMRGASDAEISALAHFLSRQGAPANDRAGAPVPERTALEP